MIIIITMQMMKMMRIIMMIEMMKMENMMMMMMMVMMLIIPKAAAGSLALVAEARGWSVCKLSSWWSSCSSWWSSCSSCWIGHNDEDEVEHVVIMMFTMMMIMLRRESSWWPGRWWSWGGGNHRGDHDNTFDDNCELYNVKMITMRLRQCLWLRNAPSRCVIDDNHDLNHEYEIMVWFSWVHITWSNCQRDAPLWQNLLRVYQWWLCHHCDRWWLWWLVIVAIANKMVIDGDEWQIKDNHQWNGHHRGMIIMMIGAIIMINNDRW